MNPKVQIEKITRHLKSPENAAALERIETNSHLEDIAESLKSHTEPVQKMNAFIEAMRGPKGETPKKNVDYFTDEEAQDFLKKATPVKDVHYRDGIDGHTPTEEELKNLIIPLIPEPISGRDGIDAEPVDEQKIIETILQKIPIPKDGHDGQTPKTHAVAKEAVKLLKELKGKERLSLRNFEEGDDIIGQVRLHSNMMKNMPKSLIDGDQRWGGHGGSSTSSGSALGSEVPTGTINNTNTSFTVANTPLYIVVNGSTLFSGGGYTLSGTTITTDSPVGTGGTIYSVYSSTAIVSGTISSEIPSGTIDNSNVTFTVGHIPVFVVINGSTIFSGDGYTYSSGTITLDSPVGTGGTIVSVHN